MNNQKYIVQKSDRNVRIDQLLTRLEIANSRSQIQKWIKEGYVKVNGKLVKANYKCRLNDSIEWQTPNVKKLTVEPKNIPIDIVYEDEDIVIVNKQRGMVVHPSKGHQTNTLVNALLYHVDNLSGINGIKRPGIVHRLDKDTTGLIVVAKNDFAHQSLSKQIENRQMERIYLTLVNGRINSNKGLIDAPIGRDPKRRIQMAVVSNGKTAKTSFKVLKRFENYTLVQCKLHTGRTHQIRVHMQYIGHSIVADSVYGLGEGHDILKGQALHATTLKLYHPKTNEWLTFTKDVPEDFQQFLQKLK